MGAQCSAVHLKNDELPNSVLSSPKPLTCSTSSKRVGVEAAQSHVSWASLLMGPLLMPSKCVDAIDTRGLSTTPNSSKTRKAAASSQHCEHNRWPMSCQERRRVICAHRVPQALCKSCRLRRPKVSGEAITSSSGQPQQQPRSPLRKHVSSVHERIPASIQEAEDETEDESNAAEDNGSSLGGGTRGTL